MENLPREKNRKYVAVKNRELLGFSPKKEQRLRKSIMYSYDLKSSEHKVILLHDKGCEYALYLTKKYSNVHLKFISGKNIEMCI